MHVLFIHRSFPAQFGHLAEYLVRERGWQCTCMAEEGIVDAGKVVLIPYQVQGGATRHNHECSRPFEDAIWRSHAVYEVLRNRPDIRPDLIVGHSGFGSTLFLRELYNCPIVNHFEYFYHRVALTSIFGRISRLPR
jgi:hypothetical protein